MYELIKKEIELYHAGFEEGARMSQEAINKDKPTYEVGYKHFKSDNLKDLQLEYLDASGICITKCEEDIQKKINNDDHLSFEEMLPYLSEVSELICKAKGHGSNSDFLIRLFSRALDGKILSKATLTKSKNHEDFGRIMRGLVLCGASKDQAERLTIDLFEHNNLKPANENCALKAYNSYTKKKKFSKIEDFIIVEYLELSDFFERYDLDIKNSEKTYRYYFELKERVRLLGLYMQKR